MKANKDDNAGSKRKGIRKARAEVEIRDLRANTSDDVRGGARGPTGGLVGVPNREFDGTECTDTCDEVVGDFDA